MLRTDPARYLAANPGVFLRETRWLAQFRPALVGADTWCFETIDPAVTGAFVSGVTMTALEKLDGRMTPWMARS